jgi:hypothetical protein
MRQHPSRRVMRVSREPLRGPRAPPGGVSESPRIRPYRCARIAPGFLTEERAIICAVLAQCVLTRIQGATGTVRGLTDLTRFPACIPRLPPVDWGCTSWQVTRTHVRRISSGRTNSLTRVSHNIPGFPRRAGCGCKAFRQVAAYSACAGPELTEGNTLPQSRAMRFPARISPLAPPALPGTTRASRVRLRTSQGTPSIGLPALRLPAFPLSGPLAQAATSRPPRRGLRVRLASWCVASRWPCARRDNTRLA